MNQNYFNALLPSDMARKAVSVGVKKAGTDPLSAVALAMTAGAFIGIAFIFYTVVTTGNASMGWGAQKLMGGLVFSLGLMLIVVNGGDLFTSTVLTVVAKADKKISWSDLSHNWAIVYVGNFAGAIGLVLLMQMAKHYEFGKGAVGLNYLSIAQAKLQYDFSQAVALGILCNILVCLGVWMTFSARSVTDKLVAVILPVAMFVASGFEHCVANMFQIPMAIMTKSNASPEFWQAIGKQPADFADLTWTAFFYNNLLPVTLGNIIGGGLLVGLVFWFIYLRNGAMSQTSEQD
jgi:formate transporter